MFLVKQIDLVFSFAQYFLHSNTVLIKIQFNNFKLMTSNNLEWKVFLCVLFSAVEKHFPWQCLIKCGWEILWRSSILCTCFSFSLALFSFKLHTKNKGKCLKKIWKKRRKKRKNNYDIINPYNRMLKRCSNVK